MMGSQGGGSNDSTRQLLVLEVRFLNNSRLKAQISLVHITLINGAGYLIMVI